MHIVEFTQDSITEEEEWFASLFAREGYQMDGGWHFVDLDWTGNVAVCHSASGEGGVHLLVRGWGDVGAIAIRRKDAAAIGAALIRWAKLGDDT